MQQDGSASYQLRRSQETQKSLKLRIETRQKQESDYRAEKDANDRLRNERNRLAEKLSRKYQTEPDQVVGLTPYLSSMAGGTIVALKIQGRFPGHCSSEKIKVAK
jgi:hypothetical protein